MTGPVDTRHLNRVRAGARATLALGIGASLAANVLAAQPTVIGRVIAAWPPVALLVTVELLSRVPVAPGWLSRLRVVAATAIAGIAAWVSYWHMAEVALEYGEAPVAAHLLPFSVDGLVVVASICLVELNRRSTSPQPNLPAAAVATADDGGQADHSPTGRSNRAAPADQPLPSRRPSNSRRSGAVRPSPALAQRVRRLAAEHPEWTKAELAKQAGCSERTVRRHLNGGDPPSNSSAPASGSPAPVSPDGSGTVTANGSGPGDSGPGPESTTEHEPSEPFEATGPVATVDVAEPAEAVDAGAPVEAMGGAR